VLCENYHVFITSQEPSNNLVWQLREVLERKLKLLSSSSLSITGLLSLCAYPYMWGQSVIDAVFGEDAFFGK
jgi:hypothetical protein